jgi:pimeloyl-ACP methyl ester carboxylesterase
MAFPPGLHVVQYPFPSDDEPLDPSAPLVVLVHGTLDRANSFRRTIGRLSDYRVVTYDRRGYQSSRSSETVVGLDGHIEDLLGVVREAVGDGAPATVVGHSLGGAVTLGAAIAEPELFASVGVYEPPMPWLKLDLPEGTPTSFAMTMSDDPDTMVEEFFRRLAVDSSWENLTDGARADRLADGPALITELRSLREGSALYDVREISVPVLFGVGGDRSAPHHRASHEWLMANVPGAAGIVVEQAGHGIHLTHPDAFAAFVRSAVERRPAASPS